MSISDLHVVLVEPEIHWNTGNAGRSCLAAGAQLHLIQPLGFSLNEKSVRRAGLDYWKHVEPRVWRSWEDFEQELPTMGQPVFFSTKGEHPYWEIEFGDRVVLIFGKETGGLPDGLRARYADHVVNIPMHSPHVRSLNLSTSVALGLYEALRQRSIREIG